MEITYSENSCSQRHGASHSRTLFICKIIQTKFPRIPVGNHCSQFGSHKTLPLVPPRKCTEFPLRRVREMVGDRKTRDWELKGICDIKNS